jgi:N4-gp56 family major capsid protein
VATFQWQFDAPTGTYKQHAMSKRLYMAALENAVFMDHVTPVEGYGKKQGENVTLTRVATITEPTSVTLTEGVRIPEDTYSISTTSITVTEIGRAVPFTSFAQDLSFFDLENSIQTRLRDQMGLALDTKAAAAFKTAQVKYIPTGLAAGTFDTDGTASTAATANLNVFHVEEIRDYLFDTLHTPPAEGDKYVGIFRTLGLRGIKRDPDWDEWHKYTDPQAKFNNEIGMIENVRFIETNHANALAKKGTGSVLGEGVVFGSDGIALAEVQTPELRAQVNVGQDFGRANAVAWYGILAFGIIWDTANAGQARIVHVTSS